MNACAHFFLLQHMIILFFSHTFKN